MNQLEIETTIQNLKHKLQTEYHVRRIALFGSVLTDNFSDSSDVDLLVDIEPDYKSYKTLLELKNELRKSLNRDIDLVFEDTINPIVRMHIGNNIKYV